MIGAPLADRDAGRDGVGGQAALGAADRGDEDAQAASVDEVQGEQARRDGHLRPVADAAQVAGVAQGDHRHARAAPTLSMPSSHRLLAHRLAEAELAVDDGERLVLEDDLAATGWPAPCRPGANRRRAARG